MAAKTGIAKSQAAAGEGDLLEIEEKSGWNAICQKFTEGYPTQATPPEMVTLQGGQLVLQGQRATRNIYTITLPVKANTEYKVSAWLQIKDRACYNYLGLNYPKKKSPLYPTANPPNDNLSKNKGIWGGRYFLNVGTTADSGVNILTPVAVDAIYIPEPQTDWFDEDDYIKTSADQTNIVISIVLEGFEGKLCIDHLNLREVKSHIDDKYLHIPIEYEFQGMKIEEVSENPLFIRTNAGQFSFSENKLSLEKNGQQVGQITFTNPDFLKNLRLTRKTGIVILENDLIILSLGADSSVLVKLKQDAELSVEGPRPGYHSFEAGIIFTTDYEKGILFSPIYPPRTINTMPMTQDLNIYECIYSDDDFAKVGLKNWNVLNDFDKDTWNVQYQFKEGDGFLVSLFPPKEFDFKKYAKETVISGNLYLPANPGKDHSGKDYAYFLQKIGERCRLVLLWLGGWDTTDNKTASKVYYLNDKGEPCSAETAGARPLPIELFRNVNGPYKVIEKKALHELVNEAHRQGLAIIVYTAPKYFYTTDPGIFLRSLKENIDEFNLDGVYFDGINQTQPLKALELVRKTRNMLKDKFCMLHTSRTNILIKKTDHFRIPVLDAYADKLVVGESVKKVDDATWRLNFTGQNVSNTVSKLKPEMRPVDYAKGKTKEEKEKNAFSLTWSPQQQIDKQLENNGEFGLEAFSYRPSIHDAFLDLDVSFDAKDYWDKFEAKCLAFTKGDGVRDTVETIYNAPQDCAPQTDEAVLTKEGNTYNCKTAYSIAQWIVDDKPFYRLHFTFDDIIATDDSDNRMNPYQKLGLKTADGRGFDPPSREDIDGRHTFKFNGKTYLFGDCDETLDFTGKSFSIFTAIKRGDVSLGPQILFALNPEKNFYFGLQDSRLTVFKVDPARTIAEENIVTEGAHSGNQCLRMIQNNSPWVETDQKIGVLAEGDYQLSVWFKTAPQHSALIKLKDGGNVHVSLSAVGNGQWQELSQVFKIEGSEARISWQLALDGAYLNADNSPIYYDDITLEKLDTVSSFIVNGGFEEGFSGWTHGHDRVAQPGFPGNTLIQDDQWHTVGMVYDSTQSLLKLYVDGVKDGEYSGINFGKFEKYGRYVIAREIETYSGRWFNGYIDDLFVTDQALTEEQAMQYQSDLHKTISLSGGEVRCIINKEGKKYTAQVGSVNSPPVLAPIGDKSIEEAKQLAFSISATDPDKDSLQYAASNLPKGASFDAAKQAFTWTPDYGQAGTYKVTFTVSDGNGGADSQTITITVNNVNRPLVIETIEDKTVDEGQQLEFYISVSDPDGNALTCSATNLPKGAELEWPTVKPHFKWHPTYGQAGTYKVTFTVSNGLLFTSETITITVNHVNRAPVLDMISNKAAAVNKKIEFTVSAQDPDGDVVKSYSVSDLPQGANFDPVTRTFSWIPSNNQIGTQRITFMASDGNLTGARTMAIVVSNNLEVLAFSGAEGFGAGSVGGRGGRVIEVTNLNDKGPGSLREAVEADGPRIVVFRVAGIINLSTWLKITNPYITIAGQSAPGIIILRNDPSNRYPTLEINAHDVIIRQIRVRSGPSIIPTDSGDTIEIVGEGAYNVILDHVSASWGTDEVLTATEYAHDITIQWSIISEGLANSSHREGKSDTPVSHSMGLSVGRATRVSVHHNLIAHNAERNPRVGYAHPADIVNNVIYNWKDYYLGISFTNSPYINFVNNYIKSGPDGNRDLNARANHIYFFNNSILSQPPVFVEGNITPNCPDGLDNSLMFRPQERIFQAPSKFDAPKVTTTSALEAYDQVLSGAGATLPQRDAVDIRVVNDVRNSSGSIIDDPLQVGGWPIVPPAIPASDSDHDGMPDEWEIAYGLSPNDPSDAAMDADEDGYTNVEEFLNGDKPVSNSAPKIDFIGDKTVNEDEVLTFTVSATDPDNDPLKYSVSGLPKGAAFDAAKHLFTWTPDYGQAGSYQVSFSVTDGSLSDSETITIKVNHTNRAPVLAPVGDKSIEEAKKLEFSISATDPDNESLTYSAAGLPSGAAFDATTQTFTWTPNSAQAGTYNVTFTVSDGELTDSQTVTITVNNIIRPNRPPIIEPIPDYTVYEGRELTFTINVSDPDPEDTLVTTLSGAPPGSSFVNYVFKWTPDFNQAGIYTLSVTASDGKEQARRDFKITVLDVAPSAKKEEPRQEVQPEEKNENYEKENSWVIVQPAQLIGVSPHPAAKASKSSASISPKFKKEEPISEEAQTELPVEAARQEEISREAEETPPTTEPSSMNFLATHQQDGSLKDIYVLNEHAETTHIYKVEEKARGSAINLLRNDKSKVYLRVDKEKNAVEDLRISVSKNVSAAEIKAEVRNIIAFMGYK